MLSATSECCYFMYRNNLVYFSYDCLVLFCFS